MITDLNKPSELNITGLCKFWFAPVDDFKYISIKHLTNIEIKYIEFEPIGNKRWLVGYHNNEITEIESNLINSDNGTIYENQINLFIPTDNEDLRYQLSRMAQQRFIIMVKETSGTVKIIGDKISACTVEFKFINKSGKKGYELIFTSKNTQPAYIYKGIIPL